MRGLFGLSARFFVFFFLVGWLFVPGFFVTAGFFAPRLLRASFPFRFVAGDLDAAKGAAEVFNFTFVVQLLVFGEFDEFQDMFHLLEGFFKGRHNCSRFLGGFGNGRNFSFRRSFWPANRGPLHVRRLGGRRLNGRRCLGWLFLRRGDRGFGDLMSFGGSGRG